MRKMTRDSRYPDSGETVFFTGRQLQSLSTLLRDGAVQLKGYVKPIEYMTSLIQCSPSFLSSDQRDILFDRVIGERAPGHGSEFSWRR